MAYAGEEFSFNVLFNCLSLGEPFRKSTYLAHMLLSLWTSVTRRLLEKHIAEFETLSVWGGFCPKLQLLWVVK